MGEGHVIHDRKFSPQNRLSFPIIDKAIAILLAITQFTNSGEPLVLVSPWSGATPQGTGQRVIQNTLSKKVKEMPLEQP